MFPRLFMEQSEMFRTAVLPLSLSAIVLIGCTEMRHHQSTMRRNLEIAKAMPADYQRAYWDDQAAKHWEEDAPDRARKAVLQEEAVQQASIREAQQGPTRRLNDDQCRKAMRGFDASISVNSGHLPPAHTPQETYCIALGQSHESVADNRFPGFLPDGARAVYSGNGHWRIYY